MGEATATDYSVRPSQQPLNQILPINSFNFPKETADQIKE